jgi:hypothetical protein
MALDPTWEGMERALAENQSRIEEIDQIVRSFAIATRVLTDRGNPCRDAREFEGKRLGERTT